MTRKYLLLLVACLALVAASCSTGGGDDEAGGGGDETTTTESGGGGDETTTTEGGGGDETTTTEAGGGGDETTTTESTRGGGGGGSRQAYVDALAESFTDPDGGLGLSQGDAECISDSWVDIFDADRLAAAGITPDDIRDDTGDTSIADVGLSESEAAGLVDTFGDCGVDLTQTMVDSMAAEQALTPEDRACLENAFNEDFLRRLFVVMLTEGEDALEEDPVLMGEMMGALFSCPGAMGLSEGSL